MNLTGSDNQSNIDTPAHETGSFEYSGSGDALFDTFSQAVSEAVAYIERFEERFEEPARVIETIHPVVEASTSEATISGADKSNRTEFTSVALDAVNAAYDESERPIVSFEVGNDQFSLGA